MGSKPSRAASSRTTGTIFMKFGRAPTTHSTRFGAARSVTGPRVGTPAAPAEDSRRQAGDELAQDESDEHRVGRDVAAHHPSRLLEQAIEPLDPELLPEPRSPAGGSGDHVDRATDAHQERDAEPWAMFAEPILLLRRAH